MTARQHPLSGDLVASRTQDHGHVDSLHDVTVAARIRVVPDAAPLDLSADLSNVIPFTRPRRAAAEPSAPPLTIGCEDRPAPPTARVGRNLSIALAAVSLAIHGVLLAMFWQEPKSLASIGVEVITVEIVIGATTEAGVATEPGENEAVAAAIDEIKPDERLLQAKEQPTTEASQDVPVAEREVAPDPKSEDQPSESEPDARPALAMVEAPRAEVPTALPRETPAEMNAIIAPPVERARPKEQKAAPKPAPKRPVQKQEPAPERKRIAARTSDQTREDARPKPSAPSTAASGVGRGRSDNDTNYRGIVAAHLARHKQYPGAARGNGTQGSGAVSFTLDGSGRVTSSSVVRSTGAAILDQELAAMARRASPFPPPPGGRAMSFTVPIGFRLN
jgi:protein TonB